ncbi:MAG: catechol-2,3-dioxygenase [Flavobacterium sp.]|jgi:catechol-2,3-dioxygenase
MTSKPDIRLDHINLLATNPEWLADWYAENFGFQAKDGFVFGPGTLLVFEKGEPLDYKGNVHFGFRCGERDSVVSWADKFSASLEQDDVYCAFKTKDPEGNVFEVYWEAGE